MALAELSQQIALYENPDHTIQLEVRTDEDTVWLTQQQMAQLFGRDVTTIRRHIKAAREEELEGIPTSANFALVHLDNNWSETPRKLNENRIRLIKLQEERPIKVIGEPFSYSLDHDFILGNPALTWLKENVLKMRKLPKREFGWRTHEAGHSIKKIAYWISDWGVPNEDELIEYAKHLLTFVGIIDYTEEEVDRVASMWARTAMQIPLWRLNGHSVSEMGGADKEPATEAA